MAQYCEWVISIYAIHNTSPLYGPLAVIIGSHCPDMIDKDGFNKYVSSSHCRFVRHFLWQVLMVDDCLLQSLIQERISQYFRNYRSREKKAAAGQSNSSSSDTSDTNSRKSCKRKRPIEEQVEDSRYQLSFVDSLIAKKCM